MRAHQMPAGTGAYSLNELSKDNLGPFESLDRKQPLHQCWYPKHMCEQQCDKKGKKTPLLHSNSRHWEGFFPNQ